MTQRLLTEARVEAQRSAAGARRGARQGRRPADRPRSAALDAGDAPGSRTRWPATTATTINAAAEALEIADHSRSPSGAWTAASARRLSGIVGRANWKAGSGPEMSDEVVLNAEDDVHPQGWLAQGGRGAARPLRARDRPSQPRRHRGRLRGLARLLDLPRRRRPGMVRQAARRPARTRRTCSISPSA